MELGFVWPLDDEHTSREDSAADSRAVGNLASMEQLSGYDAQAGADVTTSTCAGMFCLKSVLNSDVLSDWLELSKTAQFHTFTCTNQC